MKNKIKKKLLLSIERAFEQSKVKLPILLKIKLAKLILDLLAPKKRFGLLVVFGWRNKWQKFVDIPDSSQDIFARHRINIKNLQFGRRYRYDIAATIDFDGGILINRRGDIVHSGVIIEGLHPKIIANKLNPGHFLDLSEQFGFGKKVHLRHLSAITASYVFKNTTVFTASEETGDFHIFEKGRIVYSLARR